MPQTHHGPNTLELSDFRKTTFIRRSETARAIVTKLIRDPNKTGVSGYTGKSIVKDDVLNQLSAKTASNIEDAAYIFQSLPDTKIAMEIWTSCIISPKDGVTESLVWGVDQLNSEYSSELFGSLLNILKDYFENEYNIFDHLKPAIEDALFKTGSYPLVIIPESSIDDIVNGKSAISNEALLESFYVKKQTDKGNEYTVSNNLGYLGDVERKPQPRKTSLESYIDNGAMITNATVSYKPIHHGLTVTDNPDILKLQIAIAANKRKSSRSRIRRHYAMESFAKVDFNEGLNKDGKVKENSHIIKGEIEPNDNEMKNRFDTSVLNKITQTLYKDRAYSHQDVVTVKSGNQATRLPIGHPLVLKVSSAAVIPVHVPGNPRDKVGAFIILDEYGNPIEPSSANDLYDDAKTNSTEKVNAATGIIKQMNFYRDGCCNTSGGDDRTKLNELAKTYGALIEEDLLTRLANGINGDNVKLGHVEEVYRIMLSRALQGMRTQILYVPDELITYFAFDYNKYGIGKSLLTDSRNLAAMRAALTYASIYSELQNSIGRRKLRVNIDEDDPNPDKTIETTMTNFNRVNSWTLPLTSDSPVDVVNTLREHNIDVIVEGDNPAIPATQIDVEDVNVSRHVPDDQTIDKLRNLHISSFDLPPTIVDETQNTQFASTALASHSLLNRRVMVRQKIVADDLLYDHITKYTLNSGTLIKRLALEIKENRDLLTDEQRALGTAMPIIEEFLDCLTIALPAPDNMRVEDMKTDMDKQKDLIDSIIEAKLPDSVLEFLLPEPLADKGKMLKDLFKSILISRYISNNGHMPELDKLLDEDNPDDTVVAEIKSYLEPFAKLFKDSIFAFDYIRKVNDEQALKGAIPDASGGFGDSSDSGSDDFGGGDDFGGSDTDSEFGDDFGGDDGGDSDGGEPEDDLANF